ncbi:MAG TPA: UDP-N-acetylmuramate--L-alanine ligase [Candidatus Kapabacteria bacterium]|nr:UDP-N-acetylmuramate--L-alanine ligase [Candidatus Kapabacteria bacterium]HPP40070.1 UDP-N-acetylmuramate--L-alanine ligase [Candidatus Kapabacteria bacterium]
MFSTVKRLHFVGIGGIGMSGIAEILLNEGFDVSGSDIAKSENTDYLEKLGIKIYIGHNEKNIEGAEVVVYSSAVNPNENPETIAASQKNIPLLRRAEMLAEVSRLKYNIAISGTHGKTTTTSMIGLILIKAGLDPTVIVGGRLRDFGGTNARLGKGEWTVVEADEFDRSFLQLFPTIAVVNNIEAEHLDIYKDMNDLTETFAQFANKVPFYGFIALGIDDPGVKSIYAKVNKKIRTYGFSRNCDVRAERIIYENRQVRAIIFENNVELGEVTINVPGEHNLKNAMAAITVARGLNIEFEVINSALQEFKGVFRRFDIKGEKDGVLYVDDYAHHPTEVKAVLKAARNSWNRRIVAAFQPHTYTRTMHLHEQFAASFDDADVIIITDVYPAREQPIEGITGKLIADGAMKYGHKNVLYIPTLDELRRQLSDILKDGDVFITIGAGNICNLSQI